MPDEERLIYEFKFFGGPNNRYIFVTIHDVVYAVRFKPGADYVPLVELWRDDLYELTIRIVVAPEPIHIPADPVIFPTIVAIITDFFAVHERVILYICDDSDSRELARKRKFDGWYDRFGNAAFEKHDLPTVAVGPERYFASVFFRRDNPHRISIITAFDRLGTSEK